MHKKLTKFTFFSQHILYQINIYTYSSSSSKNLTNLNNGLPFHPSCLDCLES